MIVAALACPESNGSDPMSFLDHLPEDVAHLIRTRYFAEFASVTTAGVPIDPPLVPFTSEDLETIDSATGLAYPAKADRVRRNPKVGMLFEGGAEEPVVSIAGYAAVRDRDFQANLERYLSEQILTSMLSPANVDYAGVTRHAIHYFTRIILCVKPSHVRWWRHPAAMDGPPQEWRAAEGTSWPQSDPAPEGAPSKAPWAGAPPWQDIAKGALARGAAGHLTLIDGEGFPLPIRARAVHGHPEGFTLALPKWLPWSEGKATLSFEGIETFVGEASAADGQAFLRVERAMPVHPLMADPSEILAPKPATRQMLMERIEYELGRRAATLPVMPDEAPEPTAGAILRAENAFAFGGFAAAED
jgi:hypothetical protein